MIKPVVLVILDGWGECNDPKYNAIHQADTPNWDRFKSIGAVTTLDASGHSVGLPDGQMGNSEVGHMHIGAGRLIPQELTRINQAFDDGSWQNNPQIQNAFNTVKQNKSCLHIMGLLSPGGVHAHESHLFALIDYLKTQTDIDCALHAFLDGRDTPPRSAKPSIEDVYKRISNSQIKFASMTGRYYAMDRDKRWERVQPCYDLLTTGECDLTANDALAGLEAAYARDENDEFVQTTKLDDFKQINDGDVVLFMNFRADRARELSRAITEKKFDGFERKATPNVELYTLTKYQDDLDANVIFTPNAIEDTLGEVVAKQQLKQLRVAETEKYAHVTFFMNGGREEPFKQEMRKLVPSPKVATYDLKPEMSAYEVTDTLIETLNSDSYALTIVNYANADMVGHTGDLDATIKAIHTIDDCLGKLHAFCQQHNIALVITADHGNAEKMFDEASQQQHTAHTHNLVPCIYVGNEAKQVKTQSPGALIDIAPTVLSLMNIEIPASMTGTILFG